MPIFLEPRDATDELKCFESVLIVSCPVCPPMCVSIQQKRPFIELFKRGLRTGAFEDYVKSIQNALEQHGVRTDALTMRLPVPMMCLWTPGQRQRLLRRTKDFEAILVLGCDSAAYTAVDALRDTGCEVFQGMTVKTITNATAKFRFPGKVELEWHPLPTKPKFGRLGALTEDRPQNSAEPD